MNTFQNSVLIIALVIFIIVVILIGVVLVNGRNSEVWPPLIGDCPDYWVDMEGDGAKCVNVKDLGTCKNSPNKIGGHTYMNFNQAPFTGSNGDCARYQWANGCDVSWDGITYGVTNPCDDTEDNN